MMLWPFRKNAVRSPFVPAAPPAKAAEPEPDYGHYRILNRENGQPWELGHGAMGITYKAEDINLRVPVALKIISPLIADQPGAREFFLSEARGAASLRHRNAAAVHHLGTNRAGELFFAMEFIEGETVEAVIKRQRRLNVGTALDFTQQTACALAAAGQRGLIHRDLKPANLMLSDEGDGALIVKVIDFGLCKSLQPPAAPGGSVASTAKAVGGSASAVPANHFLGTPHYASPEQIRCDPNLDSRADFYSLGATLWTMLAGRPVFHGSLSAIRQRHLEEPPPFADLPDDVSEPVRKLLGSLLDKDPSGRPRTPLELIDRIEGAAYDHRGPEADPRKHWKVQGCVPLLGSVLAHNYHLEALVNDELDPAYGNSIFRAEDIAGHRPVAVQLLDRDKPLDSLRSAMERLAAAPHPNLVQNHAFSSCRGQPFVVNEWINGFPLAEVLGVRGGALPTAEAQRLLLETTQAVDHARAHGLGRLDFHPSSILVHFTGPTLTPEQRRALPAQSVESWPEFMLKLRLQARVAAKAGPEDDPAMSARESLRALGLLAAELLGSRESETVGFADPDESEAETLVNLPGATPAVRRVIHRAVSPDADFSSGGEFVTALTLAFQTEEDADAAAQTRGPMDR